MSPVSMRTSVYIRCVKCVKCPFMYPCGLLAHLQKHTDEINTLDKLSLKTGKSAFFRGWLLTLPEQNSRRRTTVHYIFAPCFSFTSTRQPFRPLNICVPFTSPNFRMPPSAPQTFFGFCVLPISVRGNMPAVRKIEVSSRARGFNPGPTALHISCLI